MLDNASKALFHLLAASRHLRTVASRYGMRHERAFARRFIAGETIEEAIVAARAIEARGLLHTLDLLGESVTSFAEADAATRSYLDVARAITDAGIIRNISLKLTQLGLDVDRATAVDNLRKILERTEGFFIRIDMESSAYTQVTLDIFEVLWDQGYRNIGVVLQADLYRTEADEERISALGARVRLVKGAYREKKDVAYQRKADVDAQYAKLTRRLLERGTYPAIATHDINMITVAREHAAKLGLAKDAFEFQMLYGIRRDLQQALVNDGYRVRVYVPFGRQWFPYFMRRLGERPANLMFVLRGLAADRG
ncbi:MAG: proline dehydrogenase family protein [Acidobacteria bacterium]|nr:proline dehydrogenase family protein [Acidobacteriota bacterium]